MGAIHEVSGIVRCPEIPAFTLLNFAKRPRMIRVILHLQVSKPDWIVLPVCSRTRSKAITDRITGVIIKDLRPINFVDGEGFQTLMSFDDPSYHLPLTHETD